ncbi:hypothetical protein [Nitrosopumilus sp.]|uniref:hypothetical protein n=1 Tax=Nitrosopumilus sp. TaxID=2024843 RepID=UPI003D12BE1C
MTKQDNSLLERTRKSLNNDQIDSCFVQFKEAVQEFVELPQVELVDRDEENNRIKLIFVPISKSNAINAPSLSISVTESCQNMEQVKAINAHAENCGMCRGGSNITFNNKNVGKFEIALANMQKIFEENYARAMKEDAEAQDFDKLVEEAFKILNVREEDAPRRRKELIGNVEGDLYADEYDKNFNINLHNLNIEQIRELSKVIPNL